MRRHTLPLIALAALALPAIGAERLPGEPVNLRADRIEIDQRKNLSRYQGHVVLTQGTLRLTADRAETRSRGQTLERVTAEGRPATFRHRPEGQPEPVEGEALRAEYEAPEQRLHLYGSETQPVRFRHRQAGQPQPLEGEALRIDYEAAARRVHLYGAVQLRRDRDQLRAGALHYDLQTETVQAEADAGQRVIAALVPRRRADAATEPAP
jgi:lipopolysaccharide export system protein LptA